MRKNVPATRIKIRAGISAPIPEKVSLAIRVGQSASATDPNTKMSPLTQTEFDQLATFVAVAEELSMEPFVSDDNHEKLTHSKSASGSDRFIAFFCHPAFLKSALMTFRKLWLESEPCEFQKIRDLVFRAHPDQAQLAGYRPWFYEIYSGQLDAPAASEWAKGSRKDILDIWIYTQAVHAGPKQTKKGKSWGKFTLQDFDQWTERIGREKFEFLFRTSLRTVASVYVEFLRKIARPLFVSLQRDFKMVPGFEAAAALKYNPYPDPRYSIEFDDVFWHLNRETMEETFERLLARHTYGILDNFFRAYFDSKRQALAAVCESDGFTALLASTGAVLLKKDDAVDDLQCRLSGTATWGTAFGPVNYEVYQGRKVRFLDGTGTAFTEAYSSFRKCLFEERKRQRPQPWSEHW